MKSHFIRLFDYDLHANSLMNGLISQRPDTAEAVKIMAHLLCTQQNWLKRCKGEDLDNYIVWPDWQQEVFAGTMKQNHSDWLAYINLLQAADYDRIVGYRNTAGVYFENTVADIITHVLNHGAHHRAQIGQHLKAAGLDLPYTDYIFYVREQAGHIS